MCGWCFVNNIPQSRRVLYKKHFMFSGLTVINRSYYPERPCYVLNCRDENCEDIVTKLFLFFNWVRGKWALLTLSILTLRRTNNKNTNKGKKTWAGQFLRHMIQSNHNRNFPFPYTEHFSRHKRILFILQQIYISPKNLHTIYKKFLRLFKSPILNHDLKAIRDSPE